MMPQGSNEVDEIMRLQAEVDAAPTGQVRVFADGVTIAYRTAAARESMEAWLIIRPDGTSVPAGLVSVGEFGPLLRWHVAWKGPR